MKLQISLDLPDLDNALSIATQVTDHCDVLEIGKVLIYKYGLQAVKTFKEKFPNKTLLADTKILDRGKLNASVFAQSHADWISVMAGTTNTVIHAACTAAKENGIKVMLDLLDANSLGQSALEAQNLGIDALLFHSPHDEKDELMFLDDWDMVSGNTDLPIFISANIHRENVEHILKLKPAGIVVGTSIATAKDPKAEAEFFYNLLKK